jgi:hypothetical protein
MYLGYYSPSTKSANHYGGGASLFDGVFSLRTHAGIVGEMHRNLRYGSIVRTVSMHSPRMNANKAAPEFQTEFNAISRNYRRKQEEYTVLFAQVQQGVIMVKDGGVSE